MSICLIEEILVLQWPNLNLLNLVSLNQHSLLQELESIEGILLRSNQPLALPKLQKVKAFSKRILPETKLLTSISAGSSCILLFSVYSSTIV